MLCSAGTFVARYPSLSVTSLVVVNTAVALPPNVFYVVKTAVTPLSTPLAFSKTAVDQFSTDFVVSQNVVASAPASSAFAKIVLGSLPHSEQHDGDLVRFHFYVCGRSVLLFY